MSQNFFHVTFLTEALLAALVQQSRDEVLGVVAYADLVTLRIRPADRCLLNQLIHGRLILVVKWRNADNHLVN